MHPWKGSNFSHKCISIAKISSGWRVRTTAIVDVHQEGCLEVKLIMYLFTGFISCLNLLELWRMDNTEH